MICGVCAAFPQFPQFPNNDFSQQGWNPNNDFFNQNPQFFPQTNLNQQQQLGQQPQQQQQPQQSQSGNQPTPAPASTTTTTPGPAFYRCFNNCPTTSEYNPVCGSDGVNYHNAHKIRCTNECGRRVNPNWIGKYQY